MYESEHIYRAQLINVLRENRPGDIAVALDVLKMRGKGWMKRLDKGLKLLNSSYPDTCNLFKATYLAQV